MAVLVVGSVALDDIESPAGKVQGVLGGAASYFSVAARYFAPVSMVAVVGHDFPQEHVDFFGARGVDVGGLSRQDGLTFRWGGRYREGGSSRETLFTELGVFEGFRPTLPEAYRDLPFTFLANIHPDLQLEVLEQARGSRFSAMDTMNFWIANTPAALRRVLARVDTLVINDEEARELTGGHNLVRAAGEIREMGPKTVIIKRGESGALLFDREGIFSAPAFPLREVRDPTGAGDSFAGGFVGSLAREGSITPDGLRRAVIYGSVMASFCVERFALDRFRDLGPEEVDARFHEFRSLTRF